MTEVLSIMAKICNVNFWIENDPLPPSELFQNSSVLVLSGIPKWELKHGFSCSSVNLIHQWVCLDWVLKI